MTGVILVGTAKHTVFTARLYIRHLRGLLIGGLVMCGVDFIGISSLPMLPQLLIGFRFERLV